ncbi:MAG: S8 family serine peptidase [Ignavibacteriae bacterium]|nr:S8 family serine peptidase [Ignavibacteriota bacterium]
MKHFKFFIITTIFFSSINIFSQSRYTEIPKPKPIAECIKQIGMNDIEGRPLYYKNQIYIKLKKNVKAFLKSPEQILGTKDYRYGITSLDEKIEKYKIKTNNTFHQRKNLLQKNKDYIQSTKQVLPDLSLIYTLEFPDEKNIINILNEYSHDDNIEYAEPVPIRYLLAIPNDTLYPLQQHLPQIKADSAWDIFKGENSSQEIIIGISDTGVEWDHPDLMNNLKQNLGEDANHNGHVIEYSENDSAWVFDPGDTNHIDDDGNGYIDDFIGWDFMTDTLTMGEGNNPQDFNSHGTHVTGIAAGCTNKEDIPPPRQRQLRMLTD